MTYQSIRDFLQDVDGLFPVPLSKKQDLNVFAQKLCEKATLCASFGDDRIVALVAGYTDQVDDDLGYISIVATRPEAQGKGLASAMVKEFLSIAARKKLRAVHLYAVKDNLLAIKMYKKLGFTVWNTINEPRPDDLHLIYYIHNEV